MSQLELIGKLLAKAEATTSQHEKDAFMQKAQLLASRNSISLARARAARASAAKPDTITYRHTAIGERGRRSLRWYVDLYDTVARHNDVRITFKLDRTSVDALGFSNDLDVVDALYSSLVTQMVEAGNAYLDSGEHRRITTERWDERRFCFVDVPLHGSTARMEFYRGWIQAINERLGEARQQAVDEATREESATPAGDDDGRLPITTAVALRDKTEQVDAEYTKHLRRNRIRTARNTVGKTAPMVRSAGHQAGHRASLGQREAIGR